MHSAIFVHGPSTFPGTPSLCMEKIHQRYYVSRYYVLVSDHSLDQTLATVSHKSSNIFRWSQLSSVISRPTCFPNHILTIRQPGLRWQNDQSSQWSAIVLFQWLQLGLKLSAATSPGSFVDHLVPAGT